MRKMKAAVIGLGSWGECHLEAFRSLPQVEIAAICDNREDRLNEMGNKFGVERRYTNYEQLMEQTDIDLVNVATFEKGHLRPTLLALQSGKHVLVEKPITTDVVEAHDMYRMAQQCGKQVIPGHLLRFDPRYAELKSAIQNGSFGQVASMFFKRSRQKSLFATYSRTHTVYELTVHDLDLAVWYAGSKVKSVRAYAQHLSENAAPESLWANLTFENGMFAVLHSNWLTPDKAGVEIFDSVEVSGSEGKAHFETSNAGLHLWNEEGSLSKEFFIHHQRNGHTYGALRDQLDYISNCILNGTGFEYVSFADAVHVIEIADAIVKSAESGQDIFL